MTKTHLKVSLESHLEAIPDQAYITNCRHGFHVWEATVNHRRWDRPVDVALYVCNVKGGKSKRCELRLMDDFTQDLTVYCRDEYLLQQGAMSVLRWFMDLPRVKAHLEKYGEVMDDK